MAQEIVIWCDPHLKGDDHERRPVVFAGPIKIGDLERHIELCAECFKIVKTVAGMIDEYGVDPALMAGAKDEDETHPHKCPVCPKRYTARTSLTTHTRETHGAPLAALERQAGMSTNGRLYKDVACDVPGCDHVSASPQGDGAHKRSKHGVVGTSKTATQARESRIHITRTEDKPELANAS